MHREQRYYYVYIMASYSGTLYVGVTGHLYRRVYQHRNHAVPGFTADYDVVRLLYFERFTSVHSAIAREKQLKGWRRAKKISLFEKTNPHWLDLARDWFKPAREIASQF